MAIGTPTSAGTSVTISAGSSATFTATASAGRLWIALFWVSAAARTVTISGGGLTWAEDKFVPASTTSGLSIWSANNPSGVSGATITATFSGAINGGGMVGFQATGIATSSPLDGSGASATPAPGAGTYSIGPAVTTNADDLIIAVPASDNFGGQVSTPSGTVINELFDFQAGNDIHVSVNYVIVSSTGSYTATGAWSAGPAEEIDLIVAYKAAGAAAATAPPPRRRLPRGLIIR